MVYLLEKKDLPVKTECWERFSATGDPSPIQALLDFWPPEAELDRFAEKFFEYRYAERPDIVGIEAGTVNYPTHWHYQSLCHARPAALGSSEMANLRILVPSVDNPLRDLFSEFGIEFQRNQTTAIDGFLKNCRPDGMSKFYGKAVAFMEEKRAGCSLGEPTVDALLKQVGEDGYRLIYTAAGALVKVSIVDLAILVALQKKQDILVDDEFDGNGVYIKKTYEAFAMHFNLDVEMDRYKFYDVNVLLHDQA